MPVMTPGFFLWDLSTSVANLTVSVGLQFFHVANITLHLSTVLDKEVTTHLNITFTHSKPCHCVL